MMTPGSSSKVRYKDQRSNPLWRPLDKEDRMVWTKELFLVKLACKTCSWRKEEWFTGRDTTEWDLPECCGQGVGATEVVAYFEDDKGRLMEGSSKGAPALVTGKN